jgi:hypothetical protein
MMRMRRPEDQRGSASTKNKDRSWLDSEPAYQFLELEIPDLKLEAYDLFDSEVAALRKELILFVCVWIKPSNKNFP